MSLEKILKNYDYEFPEKLIAQEPASPRDMARLLIYDRKSEKMEPHAQAHGTICYGIPSTLARGAESRTEDPIHSRLKAGSSGAWIKYDTFANLAKYLPENSVLVFNETKVLPARLVVSKPTGGRVKIIYLEMAGALLKVMADRKIEIGSELKLTAKFSFKAIRQEEKFYFLKPSFSPARLFGILEKYGITPIPPYIKNSPLKESELREKYQAIFAKERGSVAAPTASLHFTDRLLKKIRKAGITAKFITLHVNLGTFTPLTEKNMLSGRLHEEYYEIGRRDADFLNKAKKKSRPIIAVGTTVARTLESAADNLGHLKKISGKTDVFIRKGYEFKFIDGMITNFHVPKSSLLMLVSAFAGRKKILAIYKEAIKRKFRLFSFGDGMLIL